MYDFTGRVMIAVNIIFLIAQYLANSVIGFSLCEYLLKDKYGRKRTALIWAAASSLLQTADYVLFSFINPSPLNSALNIIVNLLGIFLLLKLLFEGGDGRTAFAALCIVSGIVLTESALHIVTSYALYGLWDLILCAVNNYSAEFYDANNRTLYFCLNFADSLISFAVYCLIYGFYLKLIKGGFKNRDCVLSRYESILLILPFVSSLCVSIALKMMNNYNFFVDESIYVRVPDARFWVFAADILLLSVNVAYVKVFQRLADYNGEKEKSRLLAAQVEQTKKEITEIQDIYSDIKGLRHDMQNHLENISLYIDRKYGEDKELKEYLGNMTNTVDKLSFSGNTGNPITDIIIEQKAAEAQKKGISLKSDFLFPQKGGIDIYHMVTILSNALQNAIEACEGEREKEIYLSSYIRGSLFFIKCENTFTGSLHFDKEGGLPKTKKSDRDFHGIGLSNIKRCAEKYMGDMDISAENGKFTLTVMLRI